jgi:peptidoglycan/xylan/chitin deacetylase (PgdA/CDA1 family)
MSLNNALVVPLMPNPTPDSLESRPAYRRIGPYLVSLVLIGLAMTVLVYLSSMQVLGWKTPVLNLGRFSSAPAALGLVDARQGVALYASANTKEYFIGIGGNYDRLLAPWRSYFSSRRERFQEFNDAAQLHQLDAGVLILPSAVALSAQERADILRFRSQGGAILATWATGTRGAKGDWDGWQFLESIGAKSLGEIAQEPPARHLVLNGESPLSHSQPAGQRIVLSNVSERLLRLQGEGMAARIMNWSRIPDTERNSEGAVIFSEPSAQAGRSALFAFAESTWESQPQPIYTLIDDTLHWLLRRPAIVRSAWPYGKQAAQVIEMDTEEGFPNALRFAAMMQEMSYRGTFYVLTSVGKLYPEVLTSLSRDFEIGYHGDVHTGFKSQTTEQQQQRIASMRAEMAAALPEIKGLSGFRAPLESYDDTTETLLQKAGIRYHVTDPSRTEARLPVFARLAEVATDNALVILPRTQRDDINMSKDKFSVEQTAQALIDDLDLSQSMGALGLLSVHSQNYASDSVLTQAMPAYLTHLKRHRDHFWLASAGQVADWWRERERFKLSVKLRGRVLDFDLSITGNSALSGASLIVILPTKGVLPTVQGLKVGMPKASVQKIDDYRAVIVFDTLNPGNYAYQASFE